MMPIACSLNFGLPRGGEIIFSNSMELEITVDKIPDWRYLLHDVNEELGLYYAEKDGYVHFLCHSGKPVKQDGYGGAKFLVETLDGAKELIGPWSSRAGVMNAHGFGPCLNVVLKKEDGGRMAGACTLAFALEAIKLCRPIPHRQETSVWGVALCKVEAEHGDVTYEPVIVKEKPLIGALLEVAK
jgi:hypothetical protein